MTDWGQLYRDHVDAVTAMAGDLTEEELGTAVPASPDWTVRDVLGHTAGVAADAVEGRMDGAPGRRWTARQVDERADRDVAALVEEMRANTEAVVAMLAGSGPPALAWDIAVHHADLHEALGRGRPPEPMWSPVAEAVVQVQAPDLDGQVPAYELFRGLFSRRSRAQMRDWGTGLDDDAIDALCLFGPREDDQPVL